MRSIPRIVTVLGALWLATALDLTPARAEDAADRAALEFFETKVRPLLVDQCIACHGPEKQKAGLRLDTAEGLRKGGDSGPVIVAGDPDQSSLVEAVRYNGEPRMPPRGKLADAEIAVLADWVKRGAHWPEPIRPEGTAPAPASPADAVTARTSDLWSLQPVAAPPLPEVGDAEWTQTPVDRFILARLEAAGLTPAPEADRRALIRRLSFDLTGLPPSPEAVQAFLTDSAPEAYERLVDRLLASPAYGERWGRHWLDLARYGEDQAHSFQPRLYPSGFRYRDWVIAAFNSDLPYDRFLTEQLAGDLLDEPGRAERLPALGFAACGPVYYGDEKGFDQIDDRIDTLARGVLGLTVACARCHDHKYDPISQADYYALAGVYKSTEYAEEPLVAREVVEAYEKGQAELKAAESAIDTFLAAETLARAESQARAAAPNVLAVWKWRRRQLTNPAVSLEQVAREEGLDPRELTRWSEHLGKAEPDLPHRRAWRRLEARTWAAPEPDLAALRAEVVAFAEGLEAQALDLIGRRLAAQAAGRKASGDKASEVLANELVGDQGVYRIPKDKAEERLAAEARQRLQGLKAERDRVKAAIPPKYPVAHALKEGKPANAPLLARGNPASAGPEVPRRFLSALGGTPLDAGSGRLQLARAVTAPENPLTDRVLVNRVWQHHFGRGLVATPSNFGTLGDRPSHPELLDDLTTRFRASGRSIKALHRLILLSATYRQSSTPAPGTAESDPENRLLGRMNRQRLEVEPWRDALLSVSGQLTGQLGGPSQSLDDPANARRTVYAKISRHDLAPLLRLFDFPEPNITSGERTRTTVPLQQLFVLNDELMARTARALVGRLASSAGDDDAARIDAAYRILFGRPPTDAERRVGLAYLAAPEPAVPEGGLKLSRWERYAQVLLGTNEFAYLD